ncbi:pyridoxamine 5'-phosphate oxidase family protein [Sphingopyxis sp. MWB1]|uniref:pyridoxamine 5'-phosphate oxidase family protein n=1 Tax=Sphingopyxis sp. MWB1 TaxID=1537715 RepID=UPI00051A14BA|nr:pyridoxamine 5'-phosphate oxidase family protein [Sphingopyxis sp. MWB1]
MSDDIKKAFWKELANNPFLMIGLSGSHDHAIPMTAQLDKDNDGYFYFFHSRSGRLARGGGAMAHYAAKGHDLFACIAGTLTPVHDRALIDQYWSKPVEAWYEGGRDDPDLLMLRFDLADAEIWTADAGIKGLFKLMTGKTIREGEIGDHERVAL